MIDICLLWHILTCDLASTVDAVLDTSNGLASPHLQTLYHGIIFVIVARTTTHTEEPRCVNSLRKYSYY